MRIFYDESEDDEIVSIQYLLRGNERSLKRKKSETLASVMKRFKKVVGKVLMPKQKGKKANKNAVHDKKEHAQGQGGSALSWEHRDANGVIKEGSGSLMVCDALSSGDTIAVLGPSGENKVRVLSTFCVAINMPTVNLVKVGRSALVGYPLLVQATTTHIPVSKCVFTWRRDEEVIYTGMGETFAHYIPTIEDEGLEISCRCSFEANLPFESSEELAAATGASVSFGAALPGPQGSVPVARVYNCVAEDGVDDAGNDRTLRIVSYNVLADGYATSTFAKTVLYPYVDPSALEEAYRENLILKELCSYDADIIFLQELTSGMYERFLLPHLRRCGYAGIYTKKAGQTNDGCGCFYRSSCLCLVDSESMEMRHIAKAPKYRGPYDAFVEACVAADSTASKDLFWKVFSSVTTTAQLLLFRFNEFSFICANTHLFFILMRLTRLLHTNTILQGAADLWEKAADCDGPPRLIFAGDLNSTPETGVVEYLSTGKLIAGLSEFESGSSFRWGDRTYWNELKRDQIEEAENNVPQNPLKRQKLGNGRIMWGSEMADVAGDSVWPVLRHELHLESACRIPPYTNFVAGFQGTLDWIFSTRGAFRVKGYLKVPPEDAIRAEVALPSSTFPSDHVALVCDLILYIS